MGIEGKGEKGKERKLNKLVAKMKIFSSFFMLIRKGNFIFARPLFLLH